MPTPSAPVNALCPWSGDPVRDDSLTVYRGHTVGFCCVGCRDRFARAVTAFDAAIAAAERSDAVQETGTPPV